MMSNCPICDKHAEILLQRSNFHFYQMPGGGSTTYPLQLNYCVTCEHAFLDPRPSTRLLEEYYSTGYEFYTSILETGLTAASEEPSLKIIATLLKPDDKVADIGGFDGYALHKLGFKGVLIDPSQQGTAIARKHGIDAITAFLDAQLAKEHAGTFDVVLSRHVIEHIEDPVAFLTHLKAICKSDGRIIIETPNLASIVRNLLLRPIHLDHLHLFSVHSLDRAAKAVGLSVSRNFEPNTLAIIAELTPEKADQRKLNLPYKEFTDKVAAVEHSIRAWLKDKHDVWIWGASTAGGALFGDYFMVEPELFKGFIDSNPTKHGKRFAAAPNLPIVSPDSVKPGAILIATYAAEEVHKEISRRGWTIPVVSLDELGEHPSRARQN